jgi:hypothetical protein
MGTVHEDQYTYLIISRSVFLRMRNISSESCTENQNTHFVFSNFFFFFENRIVYEIMWKNIVQPDRPQMKVRRMPVACWVPKTTNSQFSTATIIIRTRLLITLYVQYIAALGILRCFCQPVFPYISRLFSYKLAVFLMEFLNYEFMQESFMK